MNTSTTGALNFHLQTIALRITWLSTLSAYRIVLDGLDGFGWHQMLGDLWIYDLLDLVVICICNIQGIGCNIECNSLRTV